PGSYISVMVNISGKDYVRQYSLVKPYADTDLYEIAVKRIPGGLVSNYIADSLQENDKIIIAGTPKGDFTMRHVPEKILFMGAGIGITPLLSMLRSLRKSAIFPNVCFLYFNRSVHEISFHSEINRLASDMGIRLIHILENPADDSVKDRFRPVRYWDGKVNRELLLSAVNDINERHIYICGPAGFMNSVKSILNETGFDFKKYHSENFRPSVPEKDPSREKTFRRIKFIKSDKETIINENTTLLEAIRGTGIRIPSGCLRGMCKACQVKKISGKTQRENQDSQQKCTITACNSLPRSDIELEI
ncbi:MAG TPA: iron-sulfur cluster-binding domain-containing protein, partial [Leptospiraceae bacterium]|nr:iron-sulfur cluster-binding domain-containing protein [Leptospiraceae bacterium]